MRRTAVTLTLSATLLVGLAPSAFAADSTTGSDLAPPPIPATGTREVQFVGAGATAAAPVQHESLVSVVIPQRYDDIYNVAEAYNGSDNKPCSGCRSVAAALQIVLIKGHPSSLSPVNGAYAYNVQCTSCTAYAYAKQKLVYVPTDFRITRDLQDEVADVSRQVSRTVAGGGTPAQLDAALATLWAHLDQEVAEEVAHDGDHD